MKYSKGFTLIEILISIAIMGILAGAGYSAFIQFNQSKDVKLTAVDFANTLNEARSDTISQTSASICSSPTPPTPQKIFVGYQVTLSKAQGATNYTSYSLYLVCADAVTGAQSSTLLKTNRIPSNVILTFNKVSYFQPITDPDNNTNLIPSSAVLFAFPGGVPDSSYAASLNDKIGVGIDPNGTILQCDSSCNVGNSGQ